MEKYSLSDFAAVTDKNDGNMGSSWIWIILFIVLLGGNGNGLFGGNNATTSTLNADFLTRDIFNTNTNVSAQGCQTREAVMNSQFQTLMGFKDLSAQNAACCCELKTAIHAEGEATRGLIQANTIQALRDELSDAKTTLSNANQSQYLLGSLGRFVPYEGMNNCCGLI